jgi:hypothetical protein
MLSNQRQVTPHWIMRLFGVKSASFLLTESGLSVELVSDERYVVLTEALVDEAVYHQGLIFSKLTLKSDKGLMQLNLFEKRDLMALLRGDPPRNDQININKMTGVKAASRRKWLAVRKRSFQHVLPINYFPR